MPRGFQIGRLFGTDIFATPGFLFLLTFYIAFSKGERVAFAAIFCCAVVVSLLVHEFGHVFAVRWFMRAPSRVILWGLGGLCVHEPTNSPGKQLGISLMGPAFGLALWAILYFTVPPQPQPPTHVPGVFAEHLLFINLWWSLANLLPLWPLDGGQALQAALELRTGQARAQAITRKVSIVAAAAAIVVALNLGLLLAAVIAGLLLWQNLNRGVGSL